MSELHEGHRARLRERVAEHGFDRLKPYEVIEFLLYYALPRRDVNAAAHRLIDRFGSVYAVLTAKAEELTQVEGVGEKTARWLRLAGQAALCAGSELREDAPELRETDLPAYLAGLSGKKSGCALLCFDGKAYLIYKHFFCPTRVWYLPDFLRLALGDILAVRAASAAVAVFSDLPFSDTERARAEDFKNTLAAAGCAMKNVYLVGKEVTALWPPTLET